MKKPKNLALPQKERKHQAIIEAAITLFLKNGFAATSMDEIAKQANVSKRTVYDHFDNKENLFQAILMEHWSAIFEINKPLLPENKEVSEALTYFAKRFLAFLYQPKTINLFRLLIGEAERFPQLLDTLILNEKAPFTRELTRYLEIQKINGHFQEKNITMAAAFFMGMLKEYHFWPMMLGFTKSKQLKNPNQFIKHVVYRFLKAYS